ncbi:hypothetical protein [Thermoanaerobacterium sp. DL9XJH110]|uniref:hypothetical protein n=1 Tax=Thermoanaerobacterium sp. DL9XJH110 TaxID=3386643 RepID=UPI003BB686ED
MIKVICEINNVKGTCIPVKVHSTESDMEVCLEINGQKAVVNAADIITAVKKCTHIAIG